MAWTLLQQDNGSEAGPSHKFRVVCQTYCTETNDSGYHIVRRYYIEVLPGHDSGTWCRTCKSSWNGANVALGDAGAYDISDIDCGWQAYGTTLDSPSFYAGYTSNSGTTYRSTGTVTAYTIPQKPTTIPTWANTPGTNPNPYSTFTSSEFLSYAYSGSLWGSGSYDSMRNDTNQRILLAYAIRVNYGDVVSCTGVTDINTEGSSVSGSGTDIYVGAMEYDASGNCVCDASWMQVDNNWVVGSSAGSVLGDRTTAAWLVYLFKDNANSVITAQQVLNALGSTVYFSKPFTYIINYGGGSLNSKTSDTFYRWDTRTELRSVAADTSYTTKSFADPTRTYYNFTGWKVTPTNRTAPNGLLSSATLNSNVSSGKYYSYLFDNATFTAQWDPWQCTIEYDANGGYGAPASQKKVYGTSLYLSLTVPTKAGYTFTGWNTAKNGSGTSYRAGQQWDKDQNGGTVTLYAQWKAKPVDGFVDLYLYSDATFYAREYVEDDSMYIDKNGVLHAVEFIEGNFVSIQNSSFRTFKFVEGELVTLVDENDNELLDENGNTLFGIL